MDETTERRCKDSKFNTKKQNRAKYLHRTYELAKFVADLRRHPSEHITTKRSLNCWDDWKTRRQEDMKEIGIIWKKKTEKKPQPIAESDVYDIWFGVIVGDARLKASFYGHSAITPVSVQGLKLSYHLRQKHKKSAMLLSICVWI